MASLTYTRDNSAARAGPGSLPGSPLRILVSQAPQDGALTLAPELPASLRPRCTGPPPKRLVTMASVPSLKDAARFNLHG